LDALIKANITSDEIKQDSNPEESYMCILFMERFFCPLIPSTLGSIRMHSVNAGKVHLINFI
jgi:hypothetical protein